MHFAFDLELQKGEEDGIERGDKFMLGSVSRVKLPSKYKRCALSVDIIPQPQPVVSSTFISILLWTRYRTVPSRWRSLTTSCASLGDFNAITLKDHALLDKNGLVDAWVALHGLEDGLDGATRGVEVERHDGLGPGRLDKVAMLA